MPDPEQDGFEVQLGQAGHLRLISHLGRWSSPRLQVRLAQGAQGLKLCDPAG